MVCAIEYDDYRIVSDDDEPILVPSERFEVIDPTLPSWFIADHECCGPGAFLVPGFFERWHDGDVRFRKLFELEYARLIADDTVRNGALPMEGPAGAR